MAEKIDVCEYCDKAGINCDEFKLSAPNIEMTREQWNTEFIAFINSVMIRRTA